MSDKRLYPVSALVALTLDSRPAYARLTRAQAGSLAAFCRDMDVTHVIVHPVAFASGWSDEVGFELLPLGAAPVRGSVTGAGFVRVVDEVIA